MKGAFFCPDCGAAIAAESLPIGRVVRCASCGTLLQAPFVPRTSARSLNEYEVVDDAPSGTAYAPTPIGVPGWAWAGVGILAAIVLVIGGARWIWGWAADYQESRGHARFERVEAGLREAENSAEPTDLDELREFTIQSRTDSALRPLRGRLLVQLDRAADRLVDRELPRGRAASLEGRGEDAIAVATKMITRLEGLTDSEAASARSRTTDFVGSIVSIRGVIIEPVRLEHSLGIDDANVDFDAKLRPVIVAALTKRGYLPRPARGAPFHDVWDDRAPRLFSMTVTEDWGPPYLQTPHWTTQLDASFLLTDRDRSRTFWSDRDSVRTRVPVSGLRSAVAARAEAASRRDSEIERILHRDAHHALLSRLALKLQTQSLPDPPASER